MAARVARGRAPLCTTTGTGDVGSPALCRPCSAATLVPGRGWAAQAGLGKGKPCATVGHEPPLAKAAVRPVQNAAADDCPFVSAVMSVRRVSSCEK